MLRRRRAAAALLLILVAAAAAEEEAALLPAEPMELYFSPAELARIAGYGEEPVSSVLVSGQVACELCLRSGSDLLAFELPGITEFIPCLIFCCPIKSLAINSAFVVVYLYTSTVQRANINFIRTHIEVQILCSFTLLHVVL
jgi:hypothetical protein